MPDEVPDPVTAIAQCPACQARYRIDPTKLGKTFSCAKCGRPFQAVSVDQAPVSVISIDDGADTADEQPAEPVIQTAAATPPADAFQSLDAMQSPVARTNGMAIASLVCGIAFCVPLASVLAIIFGIIGITQTKAGHARGRGMAITGTVLGSLWLVIGIPALLIAIMLPALAQAREGANRVRCASNMRQIGLALVAYRNANQQINPPDLAALWSQQSQLTGSTFVCPSGNDTVAVDAGHLNAGGHLSYVYLPPGPGAFGPFDVVLYENAGDQKKNVGTNMLFGDGHVEWKSAVAAQSIIAQTKQRGSLSNFVPGNSFASNQLGMRQKMQALPVSPPAPPVTPAAPAVDATQFLKTFAEADQSYLNNNGRVARSPLELVQAGLLKNDQTRLGGRQRLFVSATASATELFPPDLMLAYVVDPGSSYTVLFGDWQIRTVAVADWKTVRARSASARRFATTRPQ